MKILDKNKKRPYHFSDYDSEWVNKFESIKNYLENVFGTKALYIEHIGSTSIPGMKAKPIIDVLVVVDKMEDFLEEKNKMINMGYEWGENYIAPNSLIFFIEGSDGEKTENIHVIEKGSHKEKQFIVMRDYLRSHPEKAKEYSELKQKNKELYPDDYPAYRLAKNDFLIALEKEAYDWFDSINK
jgi:GrpB-like predicted nucleotidyltransferase (UPF0157 family)